MKRLLLFCLAALLLLSAFVTKKKDKLKLPVEYVQVPAGTMRVDTSWYTYRYNGSLVVTHSSFYISKFEVSNLYYHIFFDQVAPHLSAPEKQVILCDSTGWDQVMTSSGPMKEYYYRHPSYNSYPVVNIRYEAAVKYCEWLQQKIQKDNPAYSIEVKLPTREQWTWAARGGRSQAIYPWGNYYLRNSKGAFLCNFKRVGDQAIYRNRKTGKPEVAERGNGSLTTDFFTANVRSFYPNDYGIYNICGNAAEMISERGIAMGGSWNDYGGDVSTNAEAGYTGVAPTVGFRPIIIVKEK